MPPPGASAPATATGRPRPARSRRGRTPRELRWARSLGEARQPHRFRHTRPQLFQRPTGRSGRGPLPPSRGGRACAPPVTSRTRPSSQAATPTRQPAVNAFQSATARICGVLGHVRVRVQRGLHVGMSQSATHHVHRHPGQQQRGGVTMSHPVRRPLQGHPPGQLAAQPSHQVVDRLRPPRREPGFPVEVDEHIGGVEIVTARSAPASHNATRTRHRDGPARRRHTPAGPAS